MATTTMQSSSKSRASQGFSLIEVMIGLVIGLVGLMIVYQVVTVWGGRTQTVNAGSDAQVAGTLAMYGLERDIKQAGMGFGVPRQATDSTGTVFPQIGILGCQVLTSDPIFAAGSFTLAPVTITPGAAGKPDTISVFYGHSATLTSSQAFNAQTAYTKQSLNTYGFQIGDIVVIADDTNANVPGCTPTPALAMVQVTAKTSGNITHATDADAVVGAAGPFKKGQLYNLGPYDPAKLNPGQLPQYDIWDIDQSVPGRPVLRWTNTLFTTTAGVRNEVAEGIVNLKAQYGYDSTPSPYGDNQISSSEWVTTLPGAADWTKVLAIRVAILARSRQFEKPVAGVSVTPANPAWAGGSFVMTDVGGITDSHTNGDPSPANWRNYRYKVYQNVIPLRNIVWGNESPT